MSYILSYMAKLSEERINTRLPATLRLALHRFCRQRARSVSEVVRAAVTAYLKRNKAL